MFGALSVLKMRMEWTSSRYVAKTQKLLYEAEPQQVWWILSIERKCFGYVMASPDWLHSICLTDGRLIFTTHVQFLMVDNRLLWGYSDQKKNTLIKFLLFDWENKLVIKLSTQSSQTNEQISEKILSHWKRSITRWYKSQIKYTKKDIKCSSRFVCRTVLTILVG